MLCRTGDPVELAFRNLGRRPDADCLGQANQLGNGVYIHFHQHSASVDLDGLFNNSKPVGHLLIQVSCDHEEKHFTFALG